jgi:hypothetical protein
VQPRRLRRASDDVTGSYTGRRTGHPDHVHYRATFCTVGLGCAQWT